MFSGPNHNFRSNPVGIDKPDFSLLERTIIDKYPSSWPLVRGACYRITSILQQKNVSKQMWDVVCASAAKLNYLEIWFIKKILGELTNCWESNTNPVIATFLADCLERLDRPKKFTSIVAQLNFVLNKNPNSELLVSIINGAKEVIPNSRKLHDYLYQAEMFLIENNLFSETIKREHLDNWKFKLSCLGPLIKGRWDVAASLKEIDDFLSLAPGERKKNLVLAELTILSNFHHPQTPCIPKFICDKNPKDEALALFEAALVKRSVSVAQDYWSSLVQSAVLSGQFDSYTDIAHKQFIIDQLFTLTTNQKDFIEACKYYANYIGRRHYFRKAEVLFDSIIKGDDGYLADAEVLSIRPFLVDQPPWILNTPEEVNARNEAIMIAAGVKDFSRGFGVYTMAARQFPDSSPAILERFGRDVFSSVSRINAKDITKFPGRGWLFSMPQTERILARSDADALIHDDPFLPYKQNWPFLASEIDIFHKTQILVTRGMIAIVNHDPKFRYFGEPYAYIIFNDHFHRYESQAGFLAPWKVVSEKFENCLVNNFTSEKYSESFLDINDKGLSAEYLSRRCKEVNLPLLNLSWASNLGGLCNAFAPYAQPYFEWEQKLKGEWTDEWRDLWGHTHKALIDGNWNSEGVSAMKEKLYLGMQRAHKEILAISSSYQSIAHLFKLTFSFWQKGYCDPRIGEIGLPQLSAKPFLSESLARENFLKLTLLRVAHRWHTAGHKKGLPKEAFPVLGINNVFQVSSAPELGFSLDTWDKTLRWTKEGQIKKYNLDLSEVAADDARIWLEYISPIFEDVLVAPNFFDRAVFEDLTD